MEQVPCAGYGGSSCYRRVADTGYCPIIGMCPICYRERCDSLTIVANQGGCHGFKIAKRRSSTGATRSPVQSHDAAYIVESTCHRLRTANLGLDKADVGGNKGCHGCCQEKRNTVPATGRLWPGQLTVALHFVQVLSLRGDRVRVWVEDVGGGNVGRRGRRQVGRRGSIFYRQKKIII